MASLVGQHGETVAAKFLLDKNFHLVDRNFRCRGGEIDIICQKGDSLVFVEVKARIGEIRGKPYEAVTRGKLHRLMRAVNYYLLQNKTHPARLRVDVVSIIFRPDLAVHTIKHFENVEIPQKF